MTDLSAGVFRSREHYQQMPPKERDYFCRVGTDAANDWGKPSSGVMQRLSDRRGQQFWDPNHLVAAELKKSGGNRKAFLGSPRAKWIPLGSGGRLCAGSAVA
jgi:hypothetical protein